MILIHAPLKYNGFQIIRERSSFQPLKIKRLHQQHITFEEEGKISLITNFHPNRCSPKKFRK